MTLPELRLPDVQDVADLETLLGRARTADPGGAVRLWADGSVLAVTVGLVPGHGLLGEGAVLGLRAVRLAAEATVDVVVSFEAVNDRLARMRRDASTVLSLPPVQVPAPWAAVTPPRSGWEPRGVIDLDQLRAQARDGIAEIAGGAPQGSGAAAVADLRRRVWSRPVSRGTGGTSAAGPPASGAPQAGADAAGADAAGTGGGPAAGLAFGAFALGFLAAGPATWHTCGAWQRLTTPAGHVLAR